MLYGTPQGFRHGLLLTFLDQKKRVLNLTPAPPAGCPAWHPHTHNLERNTCSRNNPRRQAYPAILRRKMRGHARTTSTRFETSIDFRSGGTKWISQHRRLRNYPKLTRSQARPTQIFPPLRHVCLPTTVFLGHRRLALETTPPLVTIVHEKGGALWYVPLINAERGLSAPAISKR